MNNKLEQNPARPEGEGGEEMLNRMNSSHKPLRDWGLSLLEWKPGLRILDIGCGGGATIADMLELSRDSFVDGVDYAEKSVEMSRKMNEKHLGKRCRIVQGDVQALPYEDETFDLITAVETVYFWPDMVNALKEVHRVTKEGGIFAILSEACEPGDHSWGEIQEHMTIYRPQELIEMLEKAGFHDVKAYRGEGEYLTVTGKK